MMSFKEQLADSSKIIGELVAANVGCNADYYREILELVLNEPMPMSSRAGRVLDICTDKCPGLFKTHVHKVINHIKKRQEIHRCILKIFAEKMVQLNTNQEGILVDACFSWLADDKQPVAIKAYCMDILERFARKEPEIIPELTGLLDDAGRTGSPGIKNKVSKIMKRLSALRL
ncbi:MAG: hypothetical protein JXB00_09130 [Bacteroidales bacterium]|nr:hypothetical protein [Bacteroidales bacterium]